MERKHFRSVFRRRRDCLIRHKHQSAYFNKGGALYIQDTDIKNQRAPLVQLPPQSLLINTRIPTLICKAFTVLWLVTFDSYRHSLSTLKPNRAFGRILSLLWLATVVSHSHRLICCISRLYEYLLWFWNL
jgi:hypothetical protein